MEALGRSDGGLCRRVSMVMASSGRVRHVACVVLCECACVCFMQWFSAARCCSS